MELVSDVGHEELVLVCLETALVSVQDRSTVCTEHTIGIEFVLDALMGLLGDEAQVQARFGLLEIVLLLEQNWCTVCVERTVGSEIVLVASD
jgi:hypothetical protein